MKLIRGQHNLKSLMPGSAVTIGNFDGLHRGHRQLINATIQAAQNHHLLSVLITFEPYPHNFFAGYEVVPRLMRLREKCIALKNTELDYLYCLHFTQALAQLTPETFVKDILCRQLNVKYIVIGDDFRFGAKRAGDYVVLKKLGEHYGFTVQQINTLQHDHQRISSSFVRESLAKGNLSLAEQLLNRPYSLCGRVVHGDKLGRELGYPTANIYLHRELVPLQGIFAVRIQGLDKTHYGAANVGNRPTVNGTQVLLEVFIFDFDQDIYGKNIQVDFLHKIRDEEKYNTLDELSEQIRLDVIATKKILNLN